MLAYVLGTVGHLALAAEKPEAAAPRVREALELAVLVDSEDDRVFALALLARIDRARGDERAAGERLAEARVLMEEPDRVSAKARAAIECATLGRWSS